MDTAQHAHRTWKKKKQKTKQNKKVNCEKERLTQLDEEDSPTDAMEEWTTKEGERDEGSFIKAAFAGQSSKGMDNSRQGLNRLVGSTRFVFDFYFIWVGVVKDSNEQLNN